MSERRFKVGRGHFKLKKAKHLLLDGSDANVHFDIEGITNALKTYPSERCLDLLDIAAAIYVADRLVTRGGPTRHRFGEGYRRNFHFEIAVRDVEFWSTEACSHALREAIEFLTDDRVNFKFVKSTTPPAAQSYFAFDPHADSAFQASQMILFSGGLDSLAGVVHTLSETDDNVVLATHRAATKVQPYQSRLVSELRLRYPGRILWTPVKVSLRKQKEADATQRSRSFLFVAIGYVVAATLGAEQLRLFENGIVSLNLPISEQVVGTMATRTTHPGTIQRLRSLLSLVADKDIDLDNPFIWMTKREVVEILATQNAGDLIEHSYSCSHVWSAHSAPNHCGTCSQCIDRRFGVLAADCGEHDPTKLYKVDLLLGARTKSEDQIMATDYVRRSQKAAQGGESGFLTAFGNELGRASKYFPGLSPLEAIGQMFDLHRRHGTEINKVLAEALQRHACEFVTSRIPDTALVRLVAGGLHLQSPSWRPPLDDDEGEAEVGSAIEAFDTLQIAFVGNHTTRVAGLTDLIGNSNRLVRCLHRQHVQDRTDELTAAQYRYVPTHSLAEEVCQGDPDYVRQCVRRCRGQIRDAYEAIVEKGRDCPQLIQTKPRSGYRLAPQVMVVGAAHAAPPSKRVSRKPP